jgi:heme/copper-type cytochrome/quinol oxidase subunit 4
MTTAGEHKSGGMIQDLIVYVCILVLAAIQFVIATQNSDGARIFFPMLIVAIVEAGLALLFFMHLWSEKRSFMWASVIVTVFVLLSMQYGWTDSFRLYHGVQWAK